VVDAADTSGPSLQDADERIKPTREVAALELLYCWRAFREWFGIDMSGGAGG